ncbi:hypothetical protein KCP78_23120 [Salmonella enterica subsp. enterica]|nr:hypothetical protein KCP78_23120 [Salmonella enterica subsp. enterica]
MCPVILKIPALQRHRAVCRHWCAALQSGAEYGYAGCRTGSIQRSPDDVDFASRGHHIPGPNWHPNGR